MQDDAKSHVSRRQYSKQSNEHERTLLVALPVRRHISTEWAQLLAQASFFAEGVVQSVPHS